MYNTLLVILLAANSFSEATPANLFSEKSIPTTYRCSKEGKFSHPFTCTQYIFCDSKLIPTEKDCPLCQNDPSRCPDGRLHYNEESKECTWADEGKCGHTNPPPPPTTPAPDCDLDCIQEGDCNCFNYCIATNSSAPGKGVWTKKWCDDNLYWNPDVPSHGGICDFWENLSPAVQEKYRNQEDCRVPELECEWSVDPLCDNRYFYLPVGSTNNNQRQHLKCPQSADRISLVWDQQRKTCKNCIPPGSCRICP